MVTLPVCVAVNVRLATDRFPSSVMLLVLPVATGAENTTSLPSGGTVLVSQLVAIHHEPPVGLIQEKAAVSASGAAMGPDKCTLIGLMGTANVRNSGSEIVCTIPGRSSLLGEGDASDN